MTDNVKKYTKEIEQTWEACKQWRARNNLDNGQITRFTGPNVDPVKSVKDILLMLSYGWEFYVGFCGNDYFISSDTGYSINNSWDDLLYETDDLDDFGENARIGEDGEFYLKDVIDELVFE